MSKRSISDKEIGLIKAMLRRSMKNRDIQFYFNRQERPVNSGRITGIRQGTYGGVIAEASDDELNLFLEQFKAGALHGPTDAHMPTESGRIAGLFGLHKGDWRLSGGETDEIECKREVDVKKLAPVVRAIAAMANNKGGLVLLGVEDKSCKVVGLSSTDFADLDLVKLTHAVKAHLQPTPSFRKGTLQIGGHTIGYVAVEPCLDRPVIVHRPGDRLDDGAILFRYPAESAPIKFGDLKTLLEDRDTRRLKALMAATQRIADMGVQNSAILNTIDGTLDVGERSLAIDKSLIDQINFIREGQFDEVHGAPTLKLIGEVHMGGGSKLPGARRLITDDDVLRNFIDQEAVVDPVEYLRYAVAGTSREWLPFMFFAQQTKLPKAELAGLIEGMETTKTQAKDRVLGRIKGTRSAFSKATGGPAKILKSIQDGTLASPESLKDATAATLAIQGLPDAHPQKDKVLQLLKICIDIIKSSRKTVALSYVYRAAARIDEIYFKLG